MAMKIPKEDTMTLDSLPEQSNVNFEGPQKIGFYSTYFDKEYKTVYCPDKSSMRYLDVNQLNKPIDCLNGYDVKKDTGNRCSKSFEAYFHWIMDNEKIVSNLCLQDEPVILTGNMELKILMLLAFYQSDFAVVAVKTKNCIVMIMDDLSNPDDKEEIEPEKESEFSPVTDYNNKLSFARFKVLKQITQRVENRELNSDYETDILHVVSFSKIGKHRIIHTGFTEFVMDKKDVDKPINEVEFGALKMMPNIYEGHRLFKISRYRHLYWWSSALVVDTKTLICGDIKKDFKIEKFDKHQASKLNNIENVTNRKKCLITLNEILSFIQSKLNVNDKLFNFYFSFEQQKIFFVPSEKSFESLVPSWFTFKGMSNK